MSIKPVLTSLEDFENYLSGSKGKEAVEGLFFYIEIIEKEFERVEKAFPLTLTDEAKQRFIDLEEIKIDLKRYILESGLMLDFEGEDWLEGKEMLEGIRPLGKVSPIKASKLLSMIMKKDVSDFGYYEQNLKKGTILIFLKSIYGREIKES
ncbi:hypothetical protein [Cecembia sp.]|uniref:hypothetical protein n=1 Tax=Cecembia sp. TaxID=1898110 RepID=UPI0025BE3415|nr:hypothetical protein [Cecembia sp.]